MERGFQRFENGDVQLTMSSDDYDRLLLILGIATVAVRPDGFITPDKVLGFANRVNEGHPGYTPYEVSEQERDHPYQGN